MSAKKDQEEPTMEEILASIRRIISEEGEPVREPDPKSSLAEAPAIDLIDEPEIELEPEDFEPEDLDLEDDVLELTEVLEEEFDQSAIDDILETEDANEITFDPKPVVEDPMAAITEAMVEDDFDNDFEAESEPDAMGPAAMRDVMKDDDFDLADTVDPRGDREAVMSPVAAASVREQFGALSDLLVTGYAGSNNTLEGVVREMLRPMLQSWLDQNLPKIVERAVASEIARLSRVKKP